MRMRTVLAAVATYLCAPADAATTEEWRAGVDAIVNDILALHPEPFGKIGELTWRRHAADFKESLPALSEPQRVVRLMQLVALLGDGHTLIDLESENYARWYPIRIYEFADGYFVTSAHKSQKELAGAELLTVAQRPVVEVMDAARGLFGADNQFDAAERLYAVHNAYLMQGLGFARADGSLEATFRLPGGAEVKRVLKPTATDKDRYPPGTPIFEWIFPSEVYGLPFGAAEDWTSAYRNLPSSAFREVDLSRPPFLQQRTRYTKRAIPERDAYYIQINQTDDAGMVGFMGEALKEVDAQRPKRLIIDMRNNFGGDGSTVTPMIHHFISRKAERPWQELYLLTGRKSFSAALAAIDAFLENTDVTLIGEPAGAPLNSLGDPVSRPNPELGLSLDVSSVRHQLSQSSDLRSFVPVDVPTPMTFKDYSAGRDPAVEPILTGAEMRAIPVIARAEGGAPARKAWLERRKRYSRLAWFRPPTEISLRFATFDLIEAERFDDAIETAKLNTEIHPYVWNTWYNLAGAYRAAPGRAADRFAAYKCVVLLEPTNWNVPSIKKLFADQKVDPAAPPGCPVKG